MQRLTVDYKVKRSSGQQRLLVRAQMNCAQSCHTDKRLTQGDDQRCVWDLTHCVHFMQCTTLCLNC
jgi:hypothetical protein